MKIIIHVLLLTLTMHVFAQDSTLLLSQSVDISNNGWNEIFRMSNGNTLLFHFENKKKVRILKYDSKGSLMSDNYNTYKLIDTNRLDDCDIEGFFELDGVLNLFVSQIAGRRDYNLIHLQYDGEGQLLKETSVKKIGITHNILYSEVLHNEAYPGYCIVHYSNGNAADSLLLTFAYYNAKHEHTKTIVHKIRSKNASKAELLAFKLGATGSVYGAVKVKWQYKNINKIQSVLYLMHIPNGYDFPIAANFNLQEGEKVSGAIISENTFSSTINFLLWEHTDIPARRNGTDLDALSEETITLVVTNQRLNIERVTPISFELVKQNTIKLYDGDKLKAEAKNKYVTDIMTDNNGVSTCLQFGVWAKDVPGIGMRKYWGNLYVTRFDDYGKELSGEVYPISRHVFTDEVSKQAIDNNADNSYLGAASYFYKKNCYIFFNDYRDNFDKAVKEDIRDVISCSATDAMYYTISKKDGVRKNYLLGEPTEQEHKQVCTETVCFDEKTGLLTGIARIVRDGKAEFHVFWKKLD